MLEDCPDLSQMLIHCPELSQMLIHYSTKDDYIIDVHQADQANQASYHEPLECSWSIG